MNNPATYPYTLDIQPCDKPAGHFLWAIRERGKLVERAMRPSESAEEAERSGLKAIERMLQHGNASRARSR
jgi:hypothetical protein